MADDRELSVKKLMLAADQDEQLRAKLLKDPEAVAKQYNVQFQPAEVEHLRKLGSLTELINEFKVDHVHVVPGPIFYPIDVWWRRVILYHIIFYHPLYHPGYPIDFAIDRLGELQVARRFAALRRR